MKKLLLIEDNEDFRINTTEILELSNYEVVVACNGVEGVEKAIAAKPDLIICDIMMPQLDGYGVFKILSKNPETSRIPFIFLTAKSENSDIREGMNLGADDYLLKPYDENTLINAIEARLQRTESFKNEPQVKNIRSFSSIGKELPISIQRLVENQKEKTYVGNEEIYREGDQVHYVFFVLEGKVKSVKNDKYGKSFVTEISHKNEFLGYKSLFEEKEYAESAYSLGECEVALIPKIEFLELIQNNLDACLIFTSLLATSLSVKEDRLLQLAYSPVRERTASALIELAETITVEENGSYYIKISRDDLANIVGTAKESLVRTLSGFKKDGVIDLKAREVIILDMDGLKSNVSLFQ